MRDLHNNIEVVTALAPTELTTVDQALEIDLTGYRGCEVIVSCGVSGDAAPVFKIKVEHASDDDSPLVYSAATAADLIGVTAIDASGYITDEDGVFDDGTSGHDIGSGDGTAHTYSFGYVGAKPNLKVTLDEDGTNTNGTTFTVHVLKAFPAHAPVG